MKQHYSIFGSCHEPAAKGASYFGGLAQQSVPSVVLLSQQTFIVGGWGRLTAVRHQHTFSLRVHLNGTRWWAPNKTKPVYRKKVRSRFSFSVMWKPRVEEIFTGHGPKGKLQDSCLLELALTIKWPTSEKSIWAVLAVSQLEASQQVSLVTFWKSAQRVAAML